MFSVVIPTHNRAPILRRALTHLLTLEGITECEVIVVNDGSVDTTAAVLDDVRRSTKLLRVIDVTNGGPGHARNCGVDAARHEYILFIDDDVFPRPGTLRSHWRLLHAGYTGSQGLVVWHSEIPITPLIRYLDARGMQFAFDKVRDDNSLEYRHVYTANFAVSKRAVIKAGGFDTRFFNRKHGFSAFEDTILGFKILSNGGRLALNRGSVSDHLHHMTEESWYERSRKVGYAIGKLRQEYPQIARELGLDRKQYFAKWQIGLLELLNRAGIIKQIFGYSFATRLHHREACQRGLLEFEHEAKIANRLVAVQ